MSSVNNKHQAEVKSQIEAFLEKRSEIKLPPKEEQIKNFTVSFLDHAANMFKNVDDLVFEDRKAICDACEYLIEKERCAKCGCFMKVKARWESSVCPLGKW